MSVDSSEMIQNLEGKKIVGMLFGKRYQGVVTKSEPLPGHFKHFIKLDYTIRIPAKIALGPSYKGHKDELYTTLVYSTNRASETNKSNLIVSVS